MTLERAQSVAVVFAVICAVLAVAAAVGRSPLPHGSPALAWPLHPLMLALGALGGWLTVLRRREIDAWRWGIAEDDETTKAERELAHREAEGQLKVSMGVFLVAPTMVGLLFGYLLRDPERVTAADLLVVTPMIGFFAALGVMALRVRD